MVDLCFFLILGSMFAVPSSINFAVHIIMYTYYFLAGLGPDVQKKIIFLKPFITQMQMVFISFICINNIINFYFHLYLYVSGYPILNNILTSHWYVSMGAYKIFLNLFLFQIIYFSNLNVQLISVVLERNFIPDTKGTFKSGEICYFNNTKVS